MSGYGTGGVLGGGPYTPSTYCPEAAQKEPDGQVHADLRALEAVISILENDWALIRSELGFVIPSFPEMATNGANIVGPPEPVRCALADRLRSFTSRVGEITASISRARRDMQL